MSDQLKHLFPNFFEPKSVAFVGASDTPGKWGFTVMLHILQGGYQGKLIPVNPKRDQVFGLPCAKSLEELDEVPDLAILVVPADKMYSVMESAIRKGIKAAVVITSGFAEAGEEGRLMQSKLLELARGAGLRFVGPNSMGIYTAFPDRLVSIMSSVIPEPGPVAILAQSGNLGVSMTSRLLRRGIGISRAVSAGNMADMNMADYLTLLEDDDKTKIVSLYIEGTDQGRNFLEAAERVTRKKPVVLLKGAKGEQGQKAAMSHTAALSGTYDTFKAAVEEIGVIVAGNMDEAVNIIGSLHTHPLPAGNRVGILTLGGGWGVLGSDACDQYGLELAELPEKMIEKLDKELPAYWSRGNPVDTVASTNSIMLIPKILQMMLRSDRFDAVLYLGAGFLSYQGKTYQDETAHFRPELAAIGDRLIDAEKLMVDTLIENRDKITKPLMPVADLISRDLQFDRNIVTYLEKNDFFVHNAPREAAQGMAALLSRRRYLDRIATKPEEFHFEANADRIQVARSIIKSASEDQNGRLTEYQSKKVLSAVDIPVTEEKEFSDLGEAVAFAEELGFPVVLKLSSPDVLHKSEAGGVILDVRNAQEVRQKGEALLEKGRILVQKMAAPSPVELLVGIKQDVMFGSVLVFGKGGVETNVWEDSSSLPTPIRPDQAERMIAATRSNKLIEAFRGRRALDRATLVEILVKISRLPEYFPEIAELDINPLFLYEEGALAVDASIILK